MPPLLAALPAAAKLISRLKKPSPRYGGKHGPLLGTVQAYMNDVVSGGTKGIARLREMYALKQRDGAAGWGAVWIEEVRGTSLPASVMAVAEELDPGYFAQVTKGDKTAPPNPTIGKEEPKPKPVAKKKTSAAAAAPRAPRAVKAKKVARYNPDTGRRVMVADDSEEALTWPSRKPSQALKKAKTKITSLALSRMASGAMKITPAKAQLLARAGVAIAGLAAGYYIGTHLNKYLAGRHRSKQEAAVQAALAFREARAAAAEAKGTDLSAAEVRSMGDVYKAQLRALGYAPGTFVKVPSVIDRFFFGEEE